MSGAKKIEKKHKKSTDHCDTKYTEEYAKKHEKGKFPRRVWPTDSEKPNHKGQKI